MWESKWGTRRCNGVKNTELAPAFLHLHHSPSIHVKEIITGGLQVKSRLRLGARKWFAQRKKLRPRQRTVLSMAVPAPSQKFHLKKHRAHLTRGSTDHIWFGLLSSDNTCYVWAHPTFLNTPFGSFPVALLHFSTPLNFLRVIALTRLQIPKLANVNCHTNTCTAVEHSDPHQALMRGHQPWKPAGSARGHQGRSLKLMN